MTPAEIANALNATNLRPRDVREVERLVTKWERQGRPASEIAMHRSFLGSIWPIVRQAEAARAALKHLERAK